MKILVFDYCLKVTGHRLPYAALVADSFRDEDEVVLCLPATIEHLPQVEAYLNVSFSVDFYPVKGTSVPMFRALEARRCLTRLVKRYQPDLVAIPTADGLAVLAGLMNLLTPFSALRQPRIDICLMRGLQQFPQQPLKQLIANIKWWMIRRGPWQRILLIDPREWSNASDATRKHVVLCPDPVPKQKFFDQTKARELLNLPTDGRIVVSVGVQHRRKGTDLLVDAFAAAKLNPNDRLVIIGKINPAIAPLIDELGRRPGFAHRVIVRDEFVTEDEFQLAIVASDVVAIPYRSVQRPSGIVCRSMAWRRPLVMTNRGWLQWVLKTFDVGFGGNPEDPDQFGKVLKTALDHDREIHSDLANEFIEFNTEENFMRTWQRGLNFDASADAQTDQLPAFNVNPTIQ